MGATFRAMGASMFGSCVLNQEFGLSVENLDQTVGFRVSYGLNKLISA